MAEIFRLRKKNAPQGDWTQDERAQFYRVGATLNRAGLAIETESGVSDEGDPWFVFCRAASDDVIVHFARCDGVYVIAAPGQAVVRGEDFILLIEALIARYAPFVDLAKTDSKVVILHPSALLFALVVTCLFNAENSEAHSLSFAPDEQASIASGFAAYDAAVVHVSPDVNERGDRNHDRELIFAFAAAIGSAVTFEQWERATAGRALYTDMPMEPQETSAPRQQSEAILADESFVTKHDSGDLRSEQQGSADDNASSLVLIPQGEISRPHLADINPQVGSSISNEAGSHNELPERSELALSSQTSAVHGAPGIFALISGDLVRFDQVQTPVEAPANHSEAYNDVMHAIGNLLTAREVTDFSDPGTRFVLQLVADQTHDAELVSRSDQMGQTKAGGEQGLPGNHGSEQIGADKSSGGRDAPAPTGFVKASYQADDAQVEKAVDDFINRHPDFQLIDSMREMILYDPDITAQNADQIEIRSYHFSDGSSIVLVGLGHDAAGF